MAFTNSKLVSYTKISPNKSVGRRSKIDTITIHCVVGQLSVETIGNVFTPASRQASSNYGIGSDGRIGMYVEEKDRSWCTSSASNDHRAITIECASDLKHPYAITQTVYNSLINLLVDICKRNEIKSLLWKGDKGLIGQVDKQNITVHRWFANTACPGDYIYNKLGQIAVDVNKKLGSTATTAKPTNVKAQSTQSEEKQSTKPFTVRIDTSYLYIRTGPGTNFDTNGFTGAGTFTIVEKQKGQGSNNGWGKLKSGVGWVSLDYCKPL